MLEYASFLPNRLEVGQDDKTAYERCKGKRAKTLGIEFGEAILWKRKPSGGALGKLSVMWSSGIYLGVKGKSGEIIVGDSRGVWKTRTIQRTPFEDRWVKSTIDLVSGGPWRTSDEDPNFDGERPEVIKLSNDQIQAERDTVQESVPKRFQIREADLTLHCFTSKCPGCNAVLRKTTRQEHSEPSRKRIEEAMKDSEKDNKSHVKFDETIAKILEKEDEGRNVSRSGMRA